MQRIFLSWYFLLTHSVKYFAGWPFGAIKKLFIAAKSIFHSLFFQWINWKILAWLSCWPLYWCCLILPYKVKYSKWWYISSIECFISLFSTCWCDVPSSINFRSYPLTQNKEEMPEVENWTSLGYLEITNCD